MRLAFLLPALLLPLLAAACAGAPPRPADEPQPVLIAPPASAEPSAEPQADNGPEPPANAPPSPPPPAESAAPPPPAPSPWLAGAAGGLRVDGNRIVLPGPIVFDATTDQIRPESAPSLDIAAAHLKATPSITLLRIEGHTDNQGGSGRNMDLSRQRALAVAKALVGRGVDCMRLLPVGFGETRPIAPNDTPQNRAQNRRIELLVAALRGRAVGGMPVDGGGIVAGDPCR